MGAHLSLIIHYSFIVMYKTVTSNAWYCTRITYRRNRNTKLQL